MEMTMGKRILIVEHDSEIASGVEFLLRREGHEVEVVLTAEDAMERIEHFPPELVFIEASLPDLSGFDLCRDLRVALASQPPYILLLSSGGDEQDVIRSKEAGADEYMPLPLVTLELLAHLRPILADTSRAA